MKHSLKPTLRQRLTLLLATACLLAATLMPAGTAQANTISVGLNTRPTSGTIVTLRVSWDSGPQ